MTAAKTAYNYASFEQLHNHLHVEGELVAQTAMRVGAGRASDVIGNDLPVLRDALSRPFIPGASLKGAFRARLEALIATVAPGEVRDFEALERFTRTEIPALKQKYRDNDRRLSQEIWQRSTMIDLTFGSPELAGRLFFKDALVQKDIWFGQFEVRNGVVLNRDTETAESGLLYDYEVVPAETRFDFELVLENAEDWQLGMVMLALQPWIRGDAQIGGFRSRGLGHIKLDEETLKCHYIQIDSVDAVLRMLECGSAQDTISFDGKRVKQWREAFAAKLTACAKAQQPEEEPRA